MKFSQLFSNFINTGRFNGTTKEATALLDESRSVILSITQRVESGEIACKTPASQPTAQAATPLSEMQKAFEKGRQVAAKSKPTPAPAAPASKTPLGDAYKKMSSSERADFLKAGNYQKIVDEQARAVTPAAGSAAKAKAAKPAKPSTPLIDSFKAMGPTARTAYLREPGNRRKLSSELTDAAISENRAKDAALAAKINPTDAAKIAARQTLNSK